MEIHCQEITLCHRTSICSSAESFRHPHSLLCCNHRLRELLDLSNMVCSNNLQQMRANIFLSRLSLKVLRQIQTETNICRRKFRAFSFTWPTATDAIFFFATKASVYIRKELNSNRIGLVRQHGRPCHCFGIPRWLP